MGCLVRAHLSVNLGLHRKLHTKQTPLQHAWFFFLCLAAVLIMCDCLLKDQMCKWHVQYMTVASLVWACVCELYHLYRIIPLPLIIRAYIIRGNGILWYNFRVTRRPRFSFTNIRILHCFGGVYVSELKMSPDFVSEIWSPYSGDSTVPGGIAHINTKNCDSSWPATPWVG